MAAIRKCPIRKCLIRKCPIHKPLSNFVGGDNDLEAYATASLYNGNNLQLFFHCVPVLVFYFQALYSLRVPLKIHFLFKYEFKFFIKPNASVLASHRTQRSTYSNLNFAILFDLKTKPRVHNIYQTRSIRL